MLESALNTPWESFADSGLSRQQIEQAEKCVQIQMPLLLAGQWVDPAP